MPDWNEEDCGENMEEVGWVPPIDFPLLNKFLEFDFLVSFMDQQFVQSFLNVSADLFGVNRLS
jgi:hypothetical protein